MLLWTAQGSGKLSTEALALVNDAGNTLHFSVVSLWEIVIKNDLGRPDFRVDVSRLRRALLANGYRELPVHGDHVVTLMTLPALHRDPFDRILLAQALAEGMELLTADAALLAYPGPVHRV